MYSFIQLYLLGFNVISAIFGVTSSKSRRLRSEGCQPSRKYDCDVKRNRFERHSGVDGGFHVRFWVKAGSPHYGFSIFDLKSCTFALSRSGIQLAATKPPLTTRPHFRGNGGMIGRSM